MRYLYSIYCIITFVVLFLLFLPFFVCFSFLREKGRKASWRLVRVWGFIWLFLIAIPVKVIYSAGKPDSGKNYIVVANHISYLDTAMIFRAIDFYAKPLAKAELAKIPLFGFLYKQIAVLVQRDNKTSKNKSIHQLKKHLEHSGSIFIFPEGAFNETEDLLMSFYDGAFRIAKETNTPILPVLFPDTKKRLHYRSIFSFSPGISRAVFLREIHMEDMAGLDVAQLKEQVRNIMLNALKQL